MASKGRRNAKMYLYHKDGGSGAQLISEPANLKVTDPAFSPDGKTLYFLIVWGPGIIMHSYHNIR